MDQFSRIFEMNCEQRQLRFHQVMVAYLQRRHYGPPVARFAPASHAI